MKIFVDEEYGYRYWCWTPKQDSMTQLAEDFDNMSEDDRQKVFFDPTSLGGEWTRIAEDDGEHLQDIYSGYLNINDAGDVRLVWNNANVY